MCYSHDIRVAQQYVRTPLERTGQLRRRAGGKIPPSKTKRIRSHRLPASANLPVPLLPLELLGPRRDQTQHMEPPPVPVSAEDVEPQLQLASRTRDTFRPFVYRTLAMVHPHLGLSRGVLLLASLLAF
jgi:hypothetical protein